MQLTTTFLQNIKQQAIEIQNFCVALNSDLVFIEKLNELKTETSSNGLLQKTEHFFVSDLIHLYEKIGEPETEISQFSLAFYYDAIRNNHFADPTQVNQLNLLIAKPEFKNHLQKIKTNNKISSSKAKDRKSVV